MRLRTKLVLTATAVTFAIVLLLSVLFLGELLRQRIEQTWATNDLQAHEVWLATRQAVVDGLEAQGREFRGSFGHAIDALSRDRSRERAELDAIAARRAGIRIELAVSTPAQGESLIWEAAALQAQESRSLVLEKDLGFQIETLQRQLEAQNEQVERELAQAAGMLEGALSGMRRITGELVRTMAEAASAIA